MTITQIETNTNNLIKNFSKDSFIFEFLLAYGEPKATITRLKKGELNLFGLHEKMVANEGK